MSHEATNWLAKLPASNLIASEFRVLFRLCDCHNPAQGCFPDRHDPTKVRLSQERGRDCSGTCAGASD